MTDTIVEEPMQVEQVSVFLENKTGRLSEVTAIMIFRIEQHAEAIRLLESKGVNVLDGERLYSI